MKEIVLLLFGFVSILPASFAQTARESNKMPAKALSPATSPQPAQSAVAAVSTLSATDIVATVDGQPISGADLLTQLQPQMAQLSNQQNEIRRRVLESLITEKLLKQEARKKGIPLDKVFQQEVDSKIPEPTDAEVQAYYLGTRQIQSLNEIKDLVRQQLKQAEIQHARAEFVKKLRQQADVAILLQPVRISVSVDPARLRGDPKAAITIVEFADYQCPYCRSEEPVLKELLARHNGEVKLAYRDFPLRELHPDAQSAAEASRCAEEQGKFWEYHDALFAASRLGRDSELEIAHRLALDIKRFESCLSGGKYEGQIEHDLQDGKTAGINGTPGFFVDGINLSGSQSLSDFERVIGSEQSYAKSARQ